MLKSGFWSALLSSSPDPSSVQKYSIPPHVIEKKTTEKPIITEYNKKRVI